MQVAAHAHGMTLGLVVRLESLLPSPRGVARFACFFDSSLRLQGGPALLVVEPSGAFFKAELEKLRLEEIGVEVSSMVACL